ncbi:MAG TPA: shikimate dehydrogenase [Pyrinomonadaceae bacterium]|nr:shikimate dehydrogenase [Pyrinomonadaceae bacterium]
MNNTKICISVCARRLDELVWKISEAAAFADVIEIRFDCLDENELDTAELSGQLRQRLSKPGSQVPRLFTFRPSEQGGRREITRGERLSFWNSVATAEFADLEEDIAAAVTISPETMKICSHHDVAGVPENLGAVYERLSRTGADIIKIVVTARNATDGIGVWKLLETAKTKGPPIVPIAMGEAGKWTRILGPAHGAFMTYASMSAGNETAPGQISADDLVDLFRVKDLDAATKVYGIIAGDTSYSVSPYLHNAAFKITGSNAVFVPLQVEDLDEFMRLMVKADTRQIDLNFKGFSVTNPHKQNIIKHLDHVEPDASAIGAVNTVKVEEGRLLGYNTDAEGFIVPLKSVFGDLRSTRAAVVGAGGGARACIYMLKKNGAAVTVFARNAVKGKTLADEFGVEFANTPALNDDKAFSEFDIIVNATPLGTKGIMENESIASAGQLTRTKLVYDLIYNPAETRLSREAKAAGIPFIGGLEMLIGQGVRQFEIWTGKDAPRAEMTAAVRKRLGS